jgi:threonine aldolase
MTRPYHAVLCAAGAHIDVDECAAPERFLGGKLLPVPTPDGKLTPGLLAPYVKGVGVQHHAQPRVVSITQSTEVGTVYTPQEVRALADWCHGRGMRLHVDGARIANAAASLGVGLRELTAECGVDALSLGGAKNGLMYGEAVVLFDPSLAEGFLYHRKQAMQLASKMRFVAAQFDALLSNDLWLRNARHANAMARLLADEAGRVPGVRLTRRPEANAAFARLPPESIPAVQAEWPFYVWDEATHEVRWVCSFDTTEEDVRGLVASLRRHVQPGDSKP